MTQFRADLHCHTICSDGSDSPSTVLELAKQAGLQGLSITDHDSIDAYTPQLFAKAGELSLRLLSGIEVSSELDDHSIHILGYGIDLHDSSFKQFLCSMQTRRSARNRAILQKLALRGMGIREEELLQAATHRTIGRPHIAQLMVQKKYVRSIKEAFDRFLGEGASCYASGIKYHPREVIDQIQKAKGRAVLAHPHFIKKGALLRKVLDLPLDGLECYYAHLAKELELPWIQIAKERGWMITGGSDYHGILRPHVALGSSWVNENTFSLLCAPR